MASHMSVNFMAVRCVAALCFAYSSIAAAYETNTHNILSIRAASVSETLGNPMTGIVEDLGLDPTRRYPDSKASRRTIESLIGFGAEHEDSRLRSGFHFLDPQHDNRGLTFGGRQASSSLDWAVFDTGILLGIVSNQDFSFLDARDYYLDALTARALATRDSKFGMLFQTLGHVAHHLQDMAQPDHVRNDEHLVVLDSNFHHIWTGYQGAGIPSFGYPKPTSDEFNTVSQLWTNARRGIAEFTSYNFVSEDTNFRGRPPSLSADSEFQSPVPDNTRIERAHLDGLVGHRPELPVTAEVWFIGNHVSDRLHADRSGFNQRASSFSIFADDLTVGGFSSETTINRFNAAAMNEWLLPRAVAYSAALFDYFFRGRIQVESSVAEGNQIRLTVRNASAQPYAFKAQLPGQGDGAEWSLYYDTTDGMRSRLPLSDDDIGEATIEPGSTYELSFPMPQNVDTTRQKPFMLVYNGVIGQEAAVAGKAFNPAAGRGFVVSPVSGPADGSSGKRQLTRMAGTWLSQPSGASAGNVDWKGHLAADTLTWDGPPSRYFYDQNRRGYSRSIYKAGNLLARAPANVQGAAISRIGEPRLIAVTYETGQLRVYTRPLRERYTNDGSYNATTNPDGWRQLYSAAELPPLTPTFFNSSATEAQLVTVSGSAIAERVKLSFANDLVARSSVNGVGRAVLRREQHDRFPEGEHVLNKGKRQVFDPETQSCSWYPDCTSRIDCGYVQPYCNITELDTLDTRLFLYETNDHVTVEGKTAICVDYDGDVEVFCEVAWLNDSVSHKSQTVRGRQEHRYRHETRCNGSVVSSSNELSYRTEVHDELWITPFTGMRTLRVGPHEIPLAGDEREDRYDSTVDYFEANQVDFAPVGSAHDYHARRHVGTRILYVDARTHTLVYETEEVGTRQNISSNRPAIDGTWQAIRATAGNFMLRETVAYVGGQRYSLLREETPPDESEIEGTLRGHGPLIVAECSNEPYEVVETDEGVLTERADWSAVIHPHANDATQGYAIDRDGNYVISQPLWKQSGSSYVRVGTWNIISDGDIDALVPGAAGGGIFAEVKLLE